MPRPFRTKAVKARYNFLPFLLLLVQYFQQRKRLNLNGQEHRQCVERWTKYLATGEQWEILSMVSDYDESQDRVEFLLIFADG